MSVEADNARTGQAAPPARHGKKQPSESNATPLEGQGSDPKSQDAKKNAAKAAGAAAKNVTETGQKQTGGRHVAQVKAKVATKAAAAKAASDAVVAEAKEKPEEKVDKSKVHTEENENNDDSKPGSAEKPKENIISNTKQSKQSNMSTGTKQSKISKLSKQSNTSKAESTLTKSSAIIDRKRSWMQDRDLVRTRMELVILRDMIRTENASRSNKSKMAALKTLLAESETEYKHQEQQRKSRPTSILT
jgi:hypothetical protein